MDCTAKRGAGVSAPSLLAGFIMKIADLQRQPKPLLGEICPGEPWREARKCVVVPQIVVTAWQGNLDLDISCSGPNGQRAAEETMPFIPCNKLTLQNKVLPRGN